MDHEVGEHKSKNYMVYDIYNYTAWWWLEPWNGLWLSHHIGKNNPNWRTPSFFRGLETTNQTNGDTPKWFIILLYGWFRGTSISGNNPNSDSGKLRVCYAKPPFWISKSTINGTFSIAMLVFRGYDSGLGLYWDESKPNMTIWLGNKHPFTSYFRVLRVLTHNYMTRTY